MTLMKCRRQNSYSLHVFLTRRSADLHGRKKWRQSHSVNAKLPIFLYNDITFETSPFNNFSISGVEQPLPWDFQRV